MDQSCLLSDSSKMTQKYQSTRGSSPIKLQAPGNSQARKSLHLRTLGWLTLNTHNALSPMLSLVNSHTEKWPWALDSKAISWCTS